MSEDVDTLSSRLLKEVSKQFSKDASPRMRRCSSRPSAYASQCVTLNASTRNEESDAFRIDDYCELRTGHFLRSRTFNTVLEGVG